MEKEDTQAYRLGYFTEPQAPEKWKRQWERVLKDWGAPKPCRSQMNGMRPEDFLLWMNNLLGKMGLEKEKATGDGYWECRCHWREERILALTRAKEGLEKEQLHDQAKGGKLTKSSAGIHRMSPVRCAPLVTRPYNAKEAPRTQAARLEEEQSTMTPADLSAYLITPPPSPSDLAFTVKEM